MSELRRDLSYAMDAVNPALCLRTLIEGQISKGVSKEVIRNELESLRKGSSDLEEDVILEVLDFLDGWCNSSLHIK
ncbi:hypothetical protein [Chitinivorax sp. B]|uniref:hypothetical protein n=1 Tax=Chitinivorax sp. B TaxID=2502235 RepID=UPI0010FA52EE|nr:hypothetical protein [Chitinivorax sp. B]